MSKPFNPETNLPARGVLPYGERGTWGHIDLLSAHFGQEWQDKIQEEITWVRLERGEDLIGLTGSVAWAIITEWKIQNPQ